MDATGPTGPVMSREEVDRALARLSAEHEAIESSLLALQDHAGRRLLEGARLTGVTERRWAEAEQAITSLWTYFDRYTDTLRRARELRGRDVTVNAVAPGPTATPLFLDGKDQESVDRLADMSPLERLGTPGDIAEAVAFLAGPARWVNGQILYVNGGVI